MKQFHRNAEQLYENLRKIQEAKGYYFNKDRERTLELLEALLVNKERYGYMACPCRLASGDKEQDRDIICPASTVNRMWPSSAVATAASTCRKTGTRSASRTNTCRSAARRKRWAFSPAPQRTSWPRHRTRGTCPVAGPRR